MLKKLINQEAESNTQVFFDNMEKGKGMYDHLEGTDIASTITPTERLNEMFLKRLEGHDVILSFPQTVEFGDIDLLESYTFEIDSLLKQGMTTSHDFTSDVMGRGIVKLDWRKHVVTLTPFGEDGKLDMAQSVIYDIHELLVFSTNHVENTKLNIGILLEISRLEDDVSMDTYLLENKRFNIMDVEVGVIGQAQKGKGYIPERPVTFKEVSDITGVPQSTLSTLKNGTRKIENLTMSTLGVLSQFGEIKKLEGMMYGMIYAYYNDDLDGDKSAVQDGDELYHIAIHMYDGREFELKTSDFYMKGLDDKQVIFNEEQKVAKFVSALDIDASYKHACEVYDSIINMYTLSKADSEGIMRLEHVTLNYERYVIVALQSKDVSHIGIVTTTYE